MFQKESHRELHLQNEDEIEKPKKDIYIYIYPEKDKKLLMN